MNWFQKIYYGIQVSDNDQFLKAIDEKNIQITELKKEVDDLALLNDENAKIILQLQSKIPKIDPLETEWNNKRPSNNSYRYKARTILNGTTNVEVDPRIFYTPVDNVIPELTKGTNDEKALNILQIVHDMIKYAPDMTQFKYDEEWLFPYETWTLKKGDCEDGAILIANILLKSGIPYWRVRLNAGTVQGGGHCWCTYLRESDNKWIILDWCYWYDTKGAIYKDAEKYYNIWFSFNTKYIYLDETFERGITNDTSGKETTRTNSSRKKATAKNARHTKTRYWKL